MADKRDELSVCNDQGVPLEDFKRAFCDRCLNQQCSRSVAGQSRFEQRTATWYQRLFENPDRLDERDPRYAQIQAQKFIEVPTGLVPEVGGAQSAWLDPRDLDAPVSPPQVAIPQPPPVPISPEPEPAAPEPQPDVPPPVPEPQPLRQTALMNTPGPRPQMIGDGQKDQPKPDKPVFVDPWEPPKPKTEVDGVKVVQPGARFRFGGSGV